MSRRLRVTAFPQSATLAADPWAAQVTDGLNQLPAFSLSSTSNGPESVVTGDSGTLLIDVGSSATTFWLKLSGSGATGWQDLLGYGLGSSKLTYGQLPVGSGTWETGSGTTITVARDLVVAGVLDIAALTGILRADSGIVSVAAGVGAKTLFDHFADIANAGTAETDLYSDSIGAGVLANNGDKLVAQYGGLFSGDATSTQNVKAYFGGTQIFDSGALAIGTTVTRWDLRVTLVRESSAVVRVLCALTTSFATLSAYADYVRITGLTLANAQILKVTGTAGGATGGSNQITAKEGYVQWLPAAA